MPSTICLHQTTNNNFTLSRNGYISLTFHCITLYTHCTTMRTAEKGLRVHVEPYIPGSLQPDQEIGLLGHHTLVLWCLETHHCPSWCIKEGTWSCTPARRIPSCLCFQSSYPYRAMIHQHRMWDVSLHLQSWMISHLCLWPCLHHRVTTNPWSKSTWRTLLIP